MILQPPNSNYFLLFNSIQIHYYSICIFLGILFSFLILIFLVKKFKLNLSLDLIFDFTPFLIIFSAIGARAYYCLGAFKYYSSNPIEIFMINKGGISIQGAILGGIIFSLIYFKIKKVKFLPYADIFATVLPFGQAIGRFGNFFNQEAFGMPVVNSPIKLFVDEQFRLNYQEYNYFHPMFLYESILNLIIFSILIFILKKTANKIDGLVFYSYILLYSFVRLILEFFRLDCTFFVFNIPFPAIVSLIGIIVSFIGILFILKNKKTI